MMGNDKRIKRVATGAVVAGLVVGTGYGGHELHRWSLHWDRVVEQGARASDGVATIAPELLTWREVGRFRTGLASVKSFAIMNEERVLVAGERKVRILSVEGKVLRDIPIEGIPQAVAASETSGGWLLFVAMKDRVEIYDSEGVSRGRWQAPGEGAFLTCLTPGAGETLWVADAGRRVVYQTDLAGKVLREIGRADSASHAPGLVVPSAHLDVVVGAGGGEGMIWINNPGRHELEAFDGRGVMVRQWGEGGAGIGRFIGCCNPTDFFMLPDGRIVTAEKGTPRVKVFDDKGILESVVTTDFAPQAAGIDVAADTAGRVWVLDPVSREVRIYGARKMEVAAHE
jgi:hypothetical protein